MTKSKCGGGSCCNNCSSNDDNVDVLRDEGGGGVVENGGEGSNFFPLPLTAVDEDGVSSSLCSSCSR